MLIIVLQKGKLCFSSFPFFINLLMKMRSGKDQEKIMVTIILLEKYVL